MIRHLRPKSLHQQTKQKIADAQAEIRKHQQQISGLMGYIQAQEELLVYLEGDKNAP